MGKHQTLHRHHKKNCHDQLKSLEVRTSCAHNLNACTLTGPGWITVPERGELVAFAHEKTLRSLKLDIDSPSNRVLLVLPEHHKSHFFVVDANSFAAEARDINTSLDKHAAEHEHSLVFFRKDGSLDVGSRGLRQGPLLEYGDRIRQLEHDEGTKKRFVGLQAKTAKVEAEIRDIIQAEVQRSRELANKITMIDTTLSELNREASKLVGSEKFDEEEEDSSSLSAEPEPPHDLSLHSFANFLDALCVAGAEESETPPRVAEPVLLPRENEEEKCIARPVSAETHHLRGRHRIGREAHSRRASRRAHSVEADILEPVNVERSRSRRCHPEILPRRKDLRHLALETRRLEKHLERLDRHGKMLHHHHTRSAEVAVSPEPPAPETPPSVSGLIEAEPPRERSRSSSSSSEAKPALADAPTPPPRERSVSPFSRLMNRQEFNHWIRSHFNQISKTQDELRRKLTDQQDKLVHHQRSLSKWYNDLRHEQLRESSR